MGESKGGTKMRAVRVGLTLVAAGALSVFVLALPAQGSSSVVPAIAGPASHPTLAPVAGQQFEVTFPVVNALNGSRLTAVTSFSFLPAIAGKEATLQQESFVSGFKAVAGVVWMIMKVPTTATGKVLKVEVTVKADGRTATRTTWYRIRRPAI
jgi:hypothetical protein